MEDDFDHIVERSRKHCFKFSSPEHSTIVEALNFQDPNTPQLLKILKKKSVLKIKWLQKKKIDAL